MNGRRKHLSPPRVSVCPRRLPWGPSPRERRGEALVLVRFQNRQDIRRRNFSWHLFESWGSGLQPVHSMPQLMWHLNVQPLT